MDISVWHYISRLASEHEGQRTNFFGRALGCRPSLLEGQYGVFPADEFRCGETQGAKRWRRCARVKLLSSVATESDTTLATNLERGQAKSGQLPVSSASGVGHKGDIRGQVPLPERPVGCFAQRYLTPFVSGSQSLGPKAQVRRGAAVCQ